MLTCPACKIQKDLKDFPNRPGTSLGVRATCRLCYNESRRQRYYKHADKARANSRTWRRANADKHRASVRRWKDDAKNGRWAVWLLRNIKSSAVRKKKRGISVTITVEYLTQLWLRQGGRCAYSGAELLLTFGSRHHDSASVDRIDSSCGYVPGNVQLVCLWINRAKGDMSDSEFKERLTTINADYISAAHGGVLNGPVARE